MIKHVVVCVMVGSSAAWAAEVDDALSAVQQAQRASDNGAACKGLATKLALATEALEHARKAKVRGVIQQAKGRLETAKDFASSACTEAVRAKVTDALVLALAAIEKYGEAPPIEKTGAAFAAACRANDACASERCFVDAAGAGYCSKVCAAASDCPPGWSCRRPGSEAEKICIK